MRQLTFAVVLGVVLHVDGAPLLRADGDASAASDASDASDVSGGASGSEAPTLNNRFPKLIPPHGAWRGAELGPQFLPPVSSAKGGSVGKLAGFEAHYPQTPLHVYRSFNLTVGNDVRAWVRKGGIL